MELLELEVYSENLELIGIVDEFVSLIWTQRFYNVGVFELRAPITENNIKLLQKTRYIYRPDAKETAFIKSIGESEQEGAKFITVSGAMLEGILDKRTISKDGYSPNLRETIYNHIDGSQNVTSYGFYNMSVGTDESNIFNDGSDREAIGRNLGEYARELLIGKNRTVKIIFSPCSKKMYCDFISGTDRSEDVVFSSENLNIYNTEYNYSEEGCYNLVEVEATYPRYVGLQRVITDPEKEWMLKVSMGNKNANSLSLTNYYELIDATIGEEYQFWADENNNVRRDVLKRVNYEDSHEKLLSLCRQHYQPYTENFAGTAIGDGYRSEWQVGDYVTIKDDKRNGSYIKQVEEVTEVFEAGSKRIDIVFGEALRTILDLIKEAGR